LPDGRRSGVYLGAMGAILPLKDAERKALYTELFVVSLTALFVELLAIRWMSADIRAFIVFRTFPLVSCFVGFGAGFARRDDRLFKFTVPALLVFVGLMKFSEVTGIDFWQFPAASVFQWQNLVVGNNSLLFLAQFIIALTVLLAGPFFLCLCIASRLGIIFNQLKPLNAYAVDLFGSLVGSLVFAGLCYAELPPWQLATIAGAILFLCSARQVRDKRILLQVACLAVIPFIGAFSPPQTAVPLASPLLKYQYGGMETYWSPYQRLDLMEYAFAENKRTTLLGLELCTNRAFYQYWLNDDVPLDKLPEELRHGFDERREIYQLPFRLGSAKDVLVVGAGTGQNVGAALDQGAESVDAVDIDPVILRLGKKYNSRYASPKVHLICDDARHYFNHCNKKYDLIIFTMLDSQAVVGSGSSVRLDAYVYTVESIKQVNKLMNPGGRAVIAFAIFKPWLMNRLVTVLTTANGYPPIVIANKTEGWKPVVYFAFGDAIRNWQKPETFPAQWKVTVARPESNIRLLTDDWPYLYVRPDIIDYPYLLVVGEILLISAFVGRRLLFEKADAGSWQLFFLGAGFLLLELHAISFLSLLYGSTWITSAIVINAILVMIMCANLLVMRFGRVFIANQQWTYGVLIGSILLSYCFPAHAFLESVPGSLGYAAVSIITVLPMFVAGIIFPSALSQSKDAARALGFNLFGSLIGGLLEYLSNFWGISSLQLLGAALYGISLLCYLRSRRTPQSAAAEPPETQPAV
jgi:SAM-dependent methyltransferase